MAMLQLGVALSNATVRITPRISWWITAQHLLSASSMAPSPSPAEDTTKDEKVENITFKRPDRESIKKHSLITAAFKTIMESGEPSTTEKSKEITKRINSASNINEVLNISKDADFNRQNASVVIYVLCDWIATGKIKMSDVQNDTRFLKICNILGHDKSSSNQLIMSKVVENKNYVSPLSGLLHVDQTMKEIERLSIHQMITVLSNLASKQKRSTPLLQILTAKLGNENIKFNIKQIADILYSMAVLSFYDETLLRKTSKNLLHVVSNNKNTAVIGSILTSLGLLRYRNEPVLDVLSTWIVEHQDIIRPQEISSLLMTLAYLGYTPRNFNEVFEQIIKPLKESDMCQSSDWLDIVWALTILNQATSEHYQSVLNSDFLNRLFDITELSISKTLKLLNVNAAVRVLMPDYKGPLVPEDSALLKTSIVRTKEKIALSNSIVSALKILLPSDSIYLNTNVNTELGFLLDAEFCVDSKCTPRPINCKSDTDKQIFRIAVLTCVYHDFCRGISEIIGPVKLHKKLLEQQGYKVLLIPYSDVNSKDKLVTRVKYINDNIKLLVQKI